MSASFEDIRVDRVKAALTDPASLAAFESLMEQLNGAMEVAVGAERAAFEMRGELGAAYMCQTCGGTGIVEDVHGDFEKCPGCGIEWFKCAECRAEADAENIRLREGLARAVAAIDSAEACIHGPQMSHIYTRNYERWLAARDEFRTGSGATGEETEP